MKLKELIKKKTRNGHKTVLFVLSTVLIGCSSSSTDRLMQSAQQHGLNLIEVDTTDYKIRAFTRARETERYLNIYLEGDGRPWISGIKKAKNPTAKNFYALKLMRLDKAPSLYLNRPCYGHVNIPENCDSKLWTSHRYSETVVASLSQAMDQIKIRFNVEYFNIIGFSGGGSLAVLLSARRNDIKALVTIAANLDHREWTYIFGYDPLTGSLNAADFFPLSSEIERWHLVGQADTHVPAQLTLESAKKDTGANIEHIGGFDHLCCWETIWQDFIENVVAR